MLGQVVDGGLVARPVEETAELEQGGVLVAAVAFVFVNFAVDLLEFENGTIVRERGYWDFSVMTGSIWCSTSSRS